MVGVDIRFGGRYLFREILFWDGYDLQKLCNNKVAAVLFLLERILLFPFVVLHRGIILLFQRVIDELFQ